MTPHGRAIRTLIERLEARIEGTEETPAHNVAALLTRLERQTAALQKLRASKNPLDTDAAHSRKIATAAQKMRAEASRIQATIKTVVTSGLAELSNAVDKKAGLIPGEHAAEIRAALREMDAKAVQMRSSRRWLMAMPRRLPPPALSRLCSAG
jgi:DNA repair exonuclease SbcCD ATPase subunit